MKLIWCNLFFPSNLLPQVYEFPPPKKFIDYQFVSQNSSFLCYIVCPWSSHSMSFILCVCKNWNDFSLQYFIRSIRESTQRLKEKTWNHKRFWKYAFWPLSLFSLPCIFIPSYICMRKRKKGRQQIITIHDEYFPIFHFSHIYSNN